MIEFIATASITAMSALLFGYWFRYTCLLILSAKTARDFASDVAAAHQLAFVGVQSSLRNAVQDMEGLRVSLDRDYAILANLLSSSSGLRTEGFAFEKSMLGLHYRVTSTWYSFARRFSPTAAQNALQEMSQIVAHYANALGEMNAVGSAA